VADETNRAASVKQLQELHAALPSLIEPIVTKVVAAAIGGASAVHDQRATALDGSIKEMKASMPPPMDLAPLILAIQQQNQLLAQCMAMMMKEDAPTTKVGTAVIGGETITLTITEKAEATH
jgi:hypothetical protein